MIIIPKDRSNSRQRGNNSPSLQAFVRSQKKIDLCADCKGPAVFVNVSPINKEYVKIRFLVDKEAKAEEKVQQ